MPYVIPTASSFKAAFTPEFDAVTDATVAREIAMAGLVIDQSWPEAAFGLAYGLYVANALRVGGFGSVAGASGSADQGGSNVKRRKAGDHEIEFFNLSDSGGASGAAGFYDQTYYGTQFRILQRRYFGGPRVY